ncbi:MAG TPA: hypothetical protein VFG79_13030 [Solirubrobacter sp.]|nr:hypothetical protein [Solirubrobacter sp.]
MYLAAVQEAVARPGAWVEVPRDFATEFNASVTAGCLRQGFLRVEPQAGDVPVTVRGKRYIATAAPVETRIDAVDRGAWRLSVRLR